MVDADTLILAADATYTTEIAAYLNHAMMRNPEARARYASIYGEEWAPLGCGAEIDDRKSTAETTTLPTVF